MLHRAAWGIDLTGGSLKAVRVEKRGRRYLVADAHELPYSEAGQGSQRLQTHIETAALRVLKSFLQDNDSAITDPIFVGVHGYGASQGQIALPPVGQERSQEMLDFELRRVLRQDPDDLVIRVGHTHRHHRSDTLSFFAHRRSVVATFQEDLRRVGCPVDGLVPEPLALMRYLDVEWPGTGHRLAIQIQRTRTDLLYLTDKGPRFRSLPIGIGSLTGVSAGSKTPPLEQVVALTKRLRKEHEQAAASFFQRASNFGLDRLLIIGTGAAIPSLVHHLGEALGQKAELVHSSRWFDVSDRLRGGVALDVAQMGTALGLAVSALHRSGEEYSLIDPPADRRSRRLRPILTLSLLVVVAGLLALRIQSSWQRRELLDLRAAVDHSAQWADQDRVEDMFATGEQTAARRDAWREESRALRREIVLPRRLLTALAGPTAFFRLVNLRQTRQGTQDQIECLVEVPDGLPGAVADLESWFGTHCEMTDVVAQPLEREGRTLQVRITGKRSS